LLGQPADLAAIGTHNAIDDIVQGYTAKSPSRHMSAVQHSGRWWSIAREYKPPAYTGYLQDSIANAQRTHQGIASQAASASRYRDAFASPAQRAQKLSRRV